MESHYSHFTCAPHILHTNRRFGLFDFDFEIEFRPTKSAARQRSDRTTVKLLYFAICAKQQEQDVCSRNALDRLVAVAPSGSSRLAVNCCNRITEPIISYQNCAPYGSATNTFPHQLRPTRTREPAECCSSSARAVSVSHFGTSQSHRRSTRIRASDSYQFSRTTDHGLFLLRKRVSLRLCAAHWAR